MSNEDGIKIANTYFMKKEYTKAKDCYEKLLNSSENKSEIFGNLGITNKVLGNMKNAIFCLEKSVDLNKKYIYGWINLGNTHKLMGHFKKAAYCYGQVVTLEPKNPEGYNNLGILFEKIGYLNKAMDSYKMALNVDPTYTKSMNNLAVLLYHQKRYDDSVKVYEVIVKTDPDNFEFLSNMGAALNKSKRYDEAIEVLKKSIKFNPKSGGAYTNLGNVYNKIYNYKEAAKQHEESIKLDPKGYNAYSNVGTSYKNMGQANKAIISYKKAIELNPTFENAHFDLATVYLSLKDFKNGWSEYEWRFKKDEMKSHLLKYKTIFNAPRLKKDMNIEGKILLLHTEQGYGDSIMFARFIDKVQKKYNCKIVLQCRDELKILFENSFKGIESFYSRDTQEAPDFDVQYSMLSLPFLLDINEVKDISLDNPYLFAKKDEEIKIQKQKGKIDIGICWSASVTGESYDGKVFDLEYFRALIDHEKFNVYSLQVGAEAKDLDDLNLTDKVIDITDKLTDFNKTACLMEQLDLVISSDTSVAHLAGSLGVEVWIPLQKIPDWRWENKGELSYWYESAKLFRQKSGREWDSVFQSIYAKLNKKYKVRIKN